MIFHVPDTPWLPYKGPDSTYLYTKDLSDKLRTGRNLTVISETRHILTSIEGTGHTLTELPRTGNILTTICGTGHTISEIPGT